MSATAGSIHIDYLEELKRYQNADLAEDIRLVHDKYTHLPHLRNKLDILRRLYDDVNSEVNNDIPIKSPIDNVILDLHLLVEKHKSTPGLFNILKTINDICIHITVARQKESLLKMAYNIQCMNDVGIDVSACYNYKDDKYIST